MVIRLAVGIAVGFALGAWLPASAMSLVVADVVQGSANLSGAGCGQVGEVVVRMPVGTRSARIVNPTADQTAVYDHGRIVARLLTRSIARDERGFLARFVAKGSDAVCANPLAFPAGWAGYFEYYVELRRSVQVYASTRCFRGLAARPRAIRVDCSHNRNLSLLRLRWTSWGGKRARGRGIARMNDCKPTCRTGHHRRYRVHVLLSRATDCGRWQYQRMTLTFPREHPAGTKRGRRYGLPFGYCPS